MAEGQENLDFLGDVILNAQGDVSLLCGSNSCVDCGGDTLNATVAGVTPCPDPPSGSGFFGYRYTGNVNGTFTLSRVESSTTTDLKRCVFEFDDLGSLGIKIHGIPSGPEVSAQVLYRVVFAKNLIQGTRTVQSSVLIYVRFSGQQVGPAHTRTVQGLFTGSDCEDYVHQNQLNGCGAPYLNLATGGTFSWPSI